jgi:hypothetical protein
MSIAQPPLLIPLAQARRLPVIFDPGNDGPGAFSAHVGSWHITPETLLPANEVAQLQETLQHLRVRTLREMNWHDEAEQAQVDADADARPLRNRVLSLVSAAWDDVVASGQAVTKVRLRDAIIARLP